MDKKIIFNEAAKKVMLNWDINEFISSHPSLYAAIKLAMKEFHYSEMKEYLNQFELIENGFIEDTNDKNGKLIDSRFSQIYVLKKEFEKEGYSNI